MKKRLSLALVGLATFAFTFHSVSALTTYNPTDWTSGGSYGSATKVDENVVTIKGAATATNGMYGGPYSNKSTAKLDDKGGIVEETHVFIDPATLNQGEFFEISAGIKNDKNEYVNEAVVMTQKIDGTTVKVTAGWASQFAANITRKGIYTYQWKMYKESAKTYVEFSIIQGKRLIATTGKIDFDTVVGPDSKLPIANETGVAFKYLWFCNVNVKDGVQVYTTLPTVKFTLVDPTGAGEDLVLDVFKWASFTADEIKDLTNQLTEAAKKEGYSFEGFYSDEAYTKKYDMTQQFVNDTVVYLKAPKIAQESTKTEVKEENPKTSDINLNLILVTIVLGSVGAGVVAKKRFSKSN